MSKEELNVCLMCFYTSVRKKDGTYYKSSLIKSLIVSFARRQTKRKFMKRASSEVDNFIKQLLRSPFCGYEINNIYFGIIVSQSCFDQFP